MRSDLNKRRANSWDRKHVSGVEDRPKNLRRRLLKDKNRQTMMTPKIRESLAGAMTPKGDTHIGVRRSIASTTGQRVEHESLMLEEAQE